MASIPSGQPAPTLAQIVAMIDSWRRLMIVWGLLPTLIVFSPVLVWSVVMVLNRISSGHGIFTAIGTLATIVWARSTIISYAPSTREKDEALYQSRWIIPLLSFVFSRQLCVNLVGPILSKLGITVLLNYVPKVRYVFALRLAGAMALLGFSVIIRFIGPLSIIRCSSFPLASHPLYAQMQSFVAKCTSFVAICELIASPSDTPDRLFRAPFSAPNVQEGRRYQSPVILRCLALILASTLIGLLLSCLLHPCLPDGTELVGLLVACSTSILLDLMFRCLDGRSHEIDPFRFQHIDSLTMASFLRMIPQKLSNLVSLLIVPMGVFWAQPKSSWNVVGPCILVSGLSSFYLITIDLIARACLCLHTLHVGRLVEEISGDFTLESTLDVILFSILHGNSELIHSTWAPAQHPGTLMIEDEEIERNDKNMEIMSKILIERDPSFSGMQLEQDILRVSILESVGGETNDSSERQTIMIKNFVHPEDAQLLTSAYGRGETLAIPFVRALCAYIGGLGLCLVKTTSRPRHAEKCITWELPPGAIACAQWAVIACSRFLVESISSKGKTVANWRCSHLSMLIPVSFHALFALRSGILTYNETQGYGRRDVDTPDSMTVLTSCDSAAASILEQLRSVDGERKVDFRVRSECRLWLEALGSKSSQSSSTVTPHLVHENATPPQRMFAYR